MKCESNAGSSRLASSLLLVSLFAVGCGESYTLLPVSGKVMLDNKPLTSGVVTFSPDTSKGNTLQVGPAAKIQGDGSYTPEVNGKPGVPAGWYKVTIQTKIPGLPAAERDAPPAYQNLDKTPLSIEIKGDKTQYDLLLTP